MEVVSRSTSRPHTVLGVVKGISCHRNAYQSRLLTSDEAMEGVKLQAAQLQADAVINVACQKKSEVDWGNTAGRRLSALATPLNSSSVDQMDRWSIYIDIEGFSALYEQENQVLHSLGVLAEGILFIGRECYPETPNRLFAHQTGDGFIIVSEFGAEVLDRPLAITMALLRHVAASGRFAKAAISQGDFADVRGCYPSSVRDAAGWASCPWGRFDDPFSCDGYGAYSCIPFGEELSKGPLLTVATAERHRIPSDLIMRETTNPDVLAIDWVHSRPPLADSLSSTVRLDSPSVDHLESALRLYCRAHKLKPDWVDNVGTLLGVVA